MTVRSQLEEAGFEALQRLYVHACTDTGQAGTLARFLLGLYNGQRFAFDLTELRSIDNSLFEDCMAVLRMDARVAAREVHIYFTDGGRKFERLAHAWELAPEPTEDRQQSQGPHKIVLADGDNVEAKLVTVGEAPGYRDVTLTLALGAKATLNLGKDDAVMLMQHIQHINEFAWGRRHRPLDAREGESRPSWLPE